MCNHLIITTNHFKSKELKTAIMNDFASISKEEKLQGFEAIKGVFLTAEEWSVQVPQKFL
jgi:hypothetical protein